MATGFNRLNMMTREGGAQPNEYLAKYAADRGPNGGDYLAQVDSGGAPSAMITSLIPSRPRTFIAWGLSSPT